MRGAERRPLTFQFRCTTHHFSAFWHMPHNHTVWKSLKKGLISQLCERSEQRFKVITFQFSRQKSHTFLRFSNTVTTPLSEMMSVQRRENQTLTSGGSNGIAVVAVARIFKRRQQYVAYFYLEEPQTHYIFPLFSCGAANTPSSTNFRWSTSQTYKRRMLTNWFS